MIKNKNKNLRKFNLYIIVSGITSPGHDLPVSGLLFHKWNKSHSVQIDSFIFIYLNMKNLIKKEKIIYIYFYKKLYI